MKVEIRADKVIVEGYVNAVGRDSRVIPCPTGDFVEQVTTKTFERALRSGNDIELRLNHDRVLGSRNSGNLELREDSIGLYARAEVTDLETMEKAQKGELRGWSFGFFKKKDRLELLENGLHRRFLEEIELREVSILDSRRTPAYVGTSIEARGQEESVLEQRGREDMPDVTTKSLGYADRKKEVEVLRLRGAST